MYMYIYVAQISNHIYSTVPGRKKRAHLQKCMRRAARKNLLLKMAISDKMTTTGCEALGAKWHEEISSTANETLFIFNGIAEAVCVCLRARQKYTHSNTQNHYT